MVISAKTRAIAEGLIASLQDSDISEHLSAARAIKNNIIGNRIKKDLYVELGLIPCLVQLLQGEGASAELQIQCLASLGSLACGDEATLAALHQYGVLDSVAMGMRSEDLDIAEAGVRTLKLCVTAAAPGSHKHLFEDKCIDRVIELLGTSRGSPNVNTNLKYMCMRLLAHCCTEPWQQLYMYEREILGCITPFLHFPMRKAKEAALECIAALVYQNTAVAEGIEASPGVVSSFLELVKDSHPEIRLGTARCLANLRAKAGLGSVMSELCVSVLPMIVKLLQAEHEKVREESPAVLAHLIEESEELTQAACEADAVNKITQSLQYHSISNDMKRGCLEALANMCARQDSTRKAVIDSKVLPIVCSSLQSTVPAVREAACRCTQSLSRSPSHVRATLADTSILELLLGLIHDDHIPVRLAAAATLNNLLLDFPRVKATVMELDGLSHFLKFLDDPHPAVRGSGIVALRNLIYWSPLSIKESVMKQLSLPKCLELIDDTPFVSEQCVCYLRNLFASHVAALSELTLEDLRALLARLTKKMDEAFQAEEKCPKDNVFVEHALWLLNHLAAADSADIQILVMDEVTLNLLTRALDVGNTEMKLAASWCICNLLWPITDAVQYQLHQQREERKKILLRYRFKDALKGLQKSGELKARAQRALALLQ